jgi:hypothetical protein
MESSIPKKPNLGNKLPAGHELRWNPETQRWAIYPIPGYSQMYLSKDKNHFVPKKKKQATLFSTDVIEDKKDGGNANANLIKAKREQNDEFYTRLDDIASELKHYRKHFEGKVVYCPCDKVYNEGRSNFFVYFATFFEELGLKALICTQYNPNPGEHGIKWVYYGDANGNGVPDESEIETEFLNGNGSFDSPECKEIMRQSDIVVTNPPFSLFRDFIAQIMDMNKKLLVIGNTNAISYKEIFPLLKENRLWLGYTQPKIFATDLEKVENEKTQFEKDGKVYQKFGNICWFTNLEHSKRQEGLSLTRNYEGREEKYPVYDNYDAIEIGHYTKNGKWEGSIDEIPMDYDDIMGVPITFLDYYSPTQFEILGLLCDNRSGGCMLNGIPTYTDERHKNSVCGVLNGKRLYPRIIIRRKK